MCCASFWCAFTAYGVWVVHRVSVLHDLSADLFIYFEVTIIGYMHLLLLIKYGLFLENPRCRHCCYFLTPL